MLAKRKVKIVAFIISVVITGALLCSLNGTFLTANADDTSPYKYVDENTMQALTNDEWVDCMIDNSVNLDKAADYVRHAIVNNQKDITIYIATAYPEYKQENNIVVKDRLLDNIFDEANSNVYNESGELIGIVGDYTREYAQLKLYGYLGVSSEACPDYSFYKFVFSLKDDNRQKDESKYVIDFVNRFNREYIKENSVIASATGEEKQFYIVKTIYNYIVKSNQYDFDVYYDRLDNEKYPENSVRYHNSHSAIGAIFGDVNVMKDAQSLDDYDLGYIYNEVIGLCMEKTVDVQGLYRPVHRNLGLSVCDGYSELFYFLCRSNNIECRVVQGDYVEPSDPHAWNLVKLGDKWYSVDTTFASQKSQKVTDEFTIVDYDLFLRGSNNADFSSDKHQQPYSIYDDLVADIDTNDYIHEIEYLDNDKLYVFVQRQNNNETTDLIENYYIISPDDKHYKINKSKDALVLSDDFVYNSREYRYRYKLLDYALGVEYLSNEQLLKNHGDYELAYTNPNGIAVTKKITVLPCDMSKWSSYNLSTSNIDNCILYDFINGNADSVIARFLGVGLNISINLYDYESTELLYGEDKDYIVRKYVKGDPERKEVIIRDPGEYCIGLEYYGNYCGYLEVPFTVTKADINAFDFSLDLTFGDIIPASFGGFTINGETNQGLEPVKLSANKDYKIVSVTGGTNYGDSGIVTVEALKSSKYLNTGTQTQWKYKITQRRDLSPLFNNKLIPSSKFTYSGNPIEPEDFILYYTVDGERTDLIKNKDYKITGYRDNVQVGTATVSVEFLGNYKGNADMKFEILQYIVAFGDNKNQFEYNGKVQKPKIYVADPITQEALTEGSDYYVVYENESSTNVGTYTATINFNNKSIKPYVVTYKIYQNSEEATVKLSATSYTYDGKVHKPTVTVTDKSGNKLKADTDYNVVYSNSNATKAGTYRITINLMGNYKGQIVTEYKINPAKFSVTTTTLKYTGKSQSTTVKVMVGSKTLVKGTDYTLSGQSATKPGAYAVKVTGKGVYAGINANAVYYIDPATLSGVKVSAKYNCATISWTKQPNCSYQIYGYDTKKKEWKYLGKTSGSSYKASKIYLNGKSVSLSANTNYKFKVRAFYSVSINDKTETRYGAFKQLETRTLPKTPSISKVTKSSKTSLKVTWKKDTAVTGYEVQLATNSGFTSGVKKATIKKNSTVSTTFKSLKKGKTYYIRVRSYKTYNKKNYYSAYSSTVKVKL